MDHSFAQEQARLALAVQEGRRALDALKAEKEAFLKNREVEATDRIARVLEQAKEAVKETDEYFHIVEQMQKEATAITEQLVSAKYSMQEQRRDFEQKTTEARNILEKKTKELEQFVATTRLERVKLEGMLDRLGVERSLLKKEQKKIDDDRVKLKAAFNVWQRQNEIKTE